MSNAARTWLVDASVYIFRAWFSLPDRWHTAAGQPLNAVVGYAGFLHELLARTGPAPHLVAAFDESLGSCFRNAIYPGYKARRELPDAALAFQLEACRELTARAGIPCFGGPRYEADDYLATLARLSRECGIPVTVLTRDKDLGQLLLGAQDHWWDFAADTTLDAAGFAARFGVQPQQFADYLALVGDNIDDIPGVPGLGPKTAAALLTAFDTLEGIAAGREAIAALPIRGARGLWARLEAHWPQVLVARELARLEDRVPGVDRLPERGDSGGGAADAGEYLASLGLGGKAVQRWRALAQESLA